MITIKDKTNIPYGKYCQQIQSVESSKNGTVIKTLRCPYFTFKLVDEGLNWREAYCTFIEDSSWKLDEHMKICGINLTKDIDTKTSG